MNNYRTDCTIIHETVIRDILDVLGGIKDFDEVKGLMGKGRSFKSLSSASSNLILVFPVITSNTISIENAAMITKAIERKAVSLLQILFSAVSITDADDAIDYIKNFHTNIKFDGDLTVDNVIDALDDFVAKSESAFISDNTLYEEAKRDLRNISNVLPDSISEHSLNEFKVYPRSVYGESMIIRESEETDEEREKKEYYREKNNREKVKLGADMNRNIYQNKKDSTSIEKNKQDIFRTQLLDSDVKKANELMPTMMVINFISTAKGEHINSQCIVGVKAKMYPVDSTDIMNRISLKNQDHNGLLKFIKATTREISFCRDFLFAIDKAKLDALSQSKKGSSSKLWKLLERRAIKSKIRRGLNHVNDASAISTLVISQEEVEYLKKTENIKLDDPKVMRPIMESYNFMGVVIVDEVLEVAKFLDDTGDDLYESVSFRNLERENSNNDYKKIINLMSKVSR